MILNWHVGIPALHSRPRDRRYSLLGRKLGTRQVSSKVQSDDGTIVAHIATNGRSEKLKKRSGTKTVFRASFRRRRVR